MLVYEHQTWIIINTIKLQKWYIVIVFYLFLSIKNGYTIWLWLTVRHGIADPFIE